MIRISHHLLLPVALACSAPAADRTTYDDHVFPIFQQACLNCHNPDKAKGGLDLSSFAATLKGSSGGKIVESGDTGASLMSVVRHTAEPKMPPEGDKLTHGEIAILQRWIEDGLLENRSSSARKPSKPKFETALRSDPSAKPNGPPPMPADVLLEPAVVTGRAAAVQALATSPWAPLLAVTGQRQILLHQTETLELVGVLPFPEGDPVSLAFTPDARYLIVGGGVPGKSGVTVTFDVTTGERLLSVAKEFDSILAADIRPGFDRVATGGPSRLLKFWDTGSGELLHSIKKHTDWITALDLSPDGVLLASGDRNGGVWVWESESASEFHTLRAHQAGITAAAFRADSNILATASEDGTVRYWEMNGGSEVRKNDAHPGGVTAFAFTRDGSSLTAGRDRSAKLWKPDFNHARDLAKDLPALPTAVALDHEGKRAFVADAQGGIRVFQTADSKMIAEIQVNPPTIATRLSDLDRSLVEAAKLADEADRLASEKSAAFATAGKSLNRAEKCHRQAVEIHRAAQTGAEQNPDPAHAKIAAEALARISPLEQELESARQSSGSAEKAAGEAAAAAAELRERVVELKASAKHWTAAAINAKALASRQQAAQSAAALDDSMHRFTETAAAVASQADRLNAKRNERERLENQFSSNTCPIHSAELEATLAALDIRIELETRTLHELETDALAIRGTIESTAPASHGEKVKTRSLQAAYEQALE